MFFMKRLLSFVLILFVMALFFNNAINWHYHRLPNGLVVEHAHPYSKSPFSADSPFARHNHTDFEFLVLGLVYHSGLIVLLAALMLSVFRESIFLPLILRPVPFYSSGNTSLPLLRAPPLV
jgi:hypothetical protein